MSVIKNFPSAADLDLDMWKADSRPQKPDGYSYRTIKMADTRGVVRVYDWPDQRDTTARRIEMLGDLYDTLRELTERARQAGLDVSQAMRVMQEFVAPKPFSANPEQDGEG